MGIRLPFGALLGRRWTEALASFLSLWLVFLPRPSSVGASPDPPRLGAPTRQPLGVGRKGSALRPLGRTPLAPGAGGPGGAGMSVVGRVLQQTPASPVPRGGGRGAGLSAVPPPGGAAARVRVPARAPPPPSAIPPLDWAGACSSHRLSRAGPGPPAPGTARGGTRMSWPSPLLGPP